MRVGLTTVAVCSLLVAGCQSNADRDAVATPTSTGTSQQISDLFRQYTNALLQRDMKTLDRLWADDLTFVNPAGDLRTKAQRMADVGSGATAFESIDTTEETVRVYCDGGAAVQVCRGTLKAKYSGRESSGDYRITVAWARPKGQWQIVAIHMTPIQK